MSRMTFKPGMSITQRSTMSKIYEISDSQSRPIRSTLTLGHKEEHPYNGLSEVSTSKPILFTHDATINEYDASNLNATVVNKCDSRNVPYISGCFGCSTCSTMRPLPPKKNSSHMPKLMAMETQPLPCLA